MMSTNVFISLCILDFQENTLVQPFLAVSDPLCCGSFGYIQAVPHTLLKIFVEIKTFQFFRQCFHFQSGTLSLKPDESFF